MSKAPDECASSWNDPKAEAIQATDQSLAQDLGSHLMTQRLIKQTSCGQPDGAAKMRSHLSFQWVVQSQCLESGRVLEGLAVPQASLPAPPTTSSKG